MERPVITIARSLGAGGEEIGAAVAKSLGFRLLDEEIIVLAAQRAGVPPEVVAETEHRTPILVRVMEMMAMSAAGEMPLESPPVVTSNVRESYQALIGEAIEETAEKGEAVIVAHGAGVRLAGMKSALRVFVTGSKDVRAGRVREQSKLNERDAMKAIEDSDRERADFLRRFYQVREELPTHYDLVLNSDNLASEESAAVIIDLANGRYRP